MLGLLLRSIFVCLFNCNITNTFTNHVSICLYDSVERELIGGCIAELWFRFHLTDAFSHASSFSLATCRFLSFDAGLTFVLYTSLQSSWIATKRLMQMAASAPAGFVVVEASYEFHGLQNRT